MRYHQRVIFRVLVMLMMALVFAHGEELPVIGFEEAAAHVGERVCVEGIITDVKKRAFYLSPTEKKRIKSALARRRDARKRRYRNSRA